MNAYVVSQVSAKANDVTSKVAAKANVVSQTAATTGGAKKLKGVSHLLLMKRIEQSSKRLEQTIKRFTRKKMPTKKRRKRKTRGRR